MVTQSATILERHLLLAGEPPPLHTHDLQRSKRRTLTKEDPMSHRIIEKRRRDRMNNCLADLSRLIPADYLKKGRGRIEKTEIIEMAIKHMKHLQSHVTCHLESCDMDRHRHPESEESFSPPENNPPKTPPIIAEHYRLGYHECLSETMHFLVEVEGFFAGDALCVQLISHLQKHCDKILKGDGLNTPRTHYGETTSTSSTGSSGGKGQNDPGSGSGCSSDGGDRSSGNNQSGEENYEGHASQLRDILTSSNLNTHSQNNRLKLMPDFPSPSHSINGSSSAIENYSSSGSLYKFKNNIKQRFSAEHSNTMVPLEPLQPIGIKRRRSDDNRRRSETSSLSSPPPNKYQQPLSPSPPPSLPGIPIFALHSKGSFYIPLTIDHHILAPFFSELNNMDTNLSSIVLHPVTISVNFQQQFTRPLKNSQCSSDVQSLQCWNQVSNNFMPLPKWAT